MSHSFKRALLAFSLTGTALLGACQAKPADDGVFRISTSFGPVYDFTKHIVGDKAEVLNTVGANEPHSFSADKMTIQQRRFVEKSDVIVTLGLHMDNWLSDLAEDYTKNVALEHTPDLQFRKIIGDIDDPHIWLSLTRAKKMVTYLAEQISEADPENAAYYEANAQAYAAEIDTVDEHFKEVFAQVEKRAFITSHEAYGYLADEYDLTQFGISSVDNGEASAKRLSEAVDFVIDNDIKVIYVEELAESDQAKTVIDGVKKKEPARQVTIKELPAYESVSDENYEKGHTYLVAMEEILDTMKADMA